MLEYLLLIHVSVGQDDVYPVYEDMSRYYEIVYYNSGSADAVYPEGSYDDRLNNMSGRACPWYCSFYRRAGSEYDPSVNYYTVQGNRLVSYQARIDHYLDEPGVPVGSNVAGYYRRVNLSRNQTGTDLYDTSGNYNASVTCNTSGGCTYYRLQGFYNSDNTENVATQENDLYYKVTRDTNIVILDRNISSVWDSSHTKPFTLTSINNNTLLNNTLTISNLNITCYNDTRIEFIPLYTTSGRSTSNPTISNARRMIYANYKNLKIGRGIRRNGDYINAMAVTGGNTSTSSQGSSSNPRKFRMIVESGLYNDISASMGMLSSNGTRPTVYINSETIVGNDYDRVYPTNDNLEVYENLNGTFGGKYNTDSAGDYLFDVTLKSGKVGTSENSYTTGIYVGGRGYQSDTISGLMRLKVEGGYSYNIIGGPLISTDYTSRNPVNIYMTGGEIDAIFGGAGESATYGNRIISITGGTVNYSVLGGSNGYISSEGNGTINGTPYIYIGGKATIGNQDLIDDDSISTFGFESGSVFGIGNGRSGSSTIGSCDNSVIVIDEKAKILSNVYGGGNYGATGVNSTSNTTTSTIKMYNGTVSGSIYGGGNNNGSGSSSKSSTITIDVLGGTVSGNVFGGSKALGRVYGNTNVNILGGTVSSVYGGGEGGYDSSNEYGTFVTGNINVKIGDNNVNTSPTVTKVYGGSAFGTVNGSANSNTVSSSKTKVEVNKGTVTSVFGGGEGDNTYTPYVLGDIEVKINGGTVTNVYGGNDLKGTPNGRIDVYVNGGSISNTFGGGNYAPIKTSYVYLNGGTSTNVYGGGNYANATTTNVYLQGGTTTTMFGGSNQSGTVTTSNITTTSGNATTIYGGNNLGGETRTANVTTNGGTMTTVYGGGNEATTGTTNVTINSGTMTTVYGGGNKASTGTTNVHLNGSTIPNVYAGGNEAGVTTSTNTILSGSSVTNLYGGSNQSGEVKKSYITTTSGNATTIYGGNNLGGKTIDSDITVNGGTIVTLYGGGNEAVTDSTLIKLTSSNVNTVYGGGNKAGITNRTTINQSGSTVTNIFGGSNQSGTVPESNITTTGGTTNRIYGGNNQGGTTTTTHVTVNGGSVDTVFGGGNEADTTTSNVTIEQTTTKCQNVYGGGNKASVATTNVTLKNNVTVGNIFGGSNESGNVTTSNVKVEMANQSPTIDNIYGGNNQGGTTASANVDVEDGRIQFIYGGGNYAQTGSTNTIVRRANVSEHVYGGGNQAAVTGNTTLKLYTSGVNGNVYGGGNLGIVGGNTYVFVSDSNINQSVYAGGKLDVEGATVVGRHVFGGGNAAATGTSENNNSSSIVNIAGLTCNGNVYGGANTSVLYGVTTVNVGKAVVQNNSLRAGTIHIKGTVFGGGEANASGSEIYDFSFISVTTGITINIDASSNTNYAIDGSIFGSGNASSTSGYSYVNIKNYGTDSNYKKNVSIQRATTVTLDNSAMLLTGATDRTNEYSDVLFSLSRIDEIKLVNGSTLYLENSTNLVKEYTSGKITNGNFEKATVTINSNGVANSNVTNKLFIYEGRNVNISTNEKVTAYGNVNGMSFFGMFVYDRDGNVMPGYFKTTYNDNSTVPSNELVLFEKGSYVLGLHKDNHNYEVDGFWSVFPDKSTTDKVDVKIITPTPEDAGYYMWVIGEQITSYEIDITASKYSTLGTYELPLVSFYAPNTSFSVLGFNYNELEPDVNLIDKDDVPRIANPREKADTDMSLVMKTSDQGWITKGKTTFYSSEEFFGGTTSYLSENSNAVPTFLFYLYHSKNLNTEGSMGSATISMVAITPIDDLNNEVKRINITVNLTRAIFDTDDYEGTFTSGKAYEMFAPGAVNITTTSSFSSYYSLYVESENTVYRNGYHRVLASSYNLPKDTKITMIDLLSGTRPEYYYYVVSQADYDAKTLQIQQNNEATYDLSKFVRMGSSNDNNHYDDATKNALYYNSTGQYAEEEFIFIVDFKESGITQDVLEQSLMLELRSSEDEIIYSVIGVEQQQLFYNLYANRDSVIDVTGSLSTNDVYIGEDVNLYVDTNFIEPTINTNKIVDTNFHDYKTGIKLSILDSNGNVVNGPSIMGLSYSIGNTNYYPRFDGTVRINVAERIANVHTNIIIHTDGSNLSSGEYEMLIESFGSPDGIYYGLSASDSVRIPFTVKNTVYGLKVNASDGELLVKKDTGENESGTNVISFNFEYSSGLLNPNVRVSLYRRSYDDIYSDTYSLVDFKDFFSDNLSTTNAEKIYMLFDSPQATMSKALSMKDNLTSGTYKIVFALYDNDTYIGDVCKYIIIK